MMGNQGAEKCWNRHSQAEGDADYNIPDLSFLFYYTTFHKMWKKQGIGER